MVRLGVPPVITHLLLFGPKVAAIRQQAVDRAAALKAGALLLPFHDGQADSGSGGSGVYGSGGAYTVGASMHAQPSSEPGIGDVGGRSSKRVVPLERSGQRSGRGSVEGGVGSVGSGVYSGGRGSGTIPAVGKGGEPALSPGGSPDPARREPSAPAAPSAAAGSPGAPPPV